MDASEIENAIEELELRLERLRSLYEQYFLGIEKIEPTIARKDVDRRIWLLRREKIRNTAKRFKLQTIIQRYNTFQQYWQRICREIENGTYKRHVLRAQRLASQDLLTIAARRRLGRQPPRSSAPPASDEALPVDEALSAVAARNNGEPSSTKETETRVGSSPPRPPTLRPITARPVPPRPATSRPPRPPTERPAAKQAFETLEFDFDFLGDWDPSEGLRKQRRDVVKPAPAAPAKAAAPPAAARVVPPAMPGRPSSATPNVSTQSARPSGQAAARPAASKPAPVQSAPGGVDRPVPSAPAAKVPAAPAVKAPATRVANPAPAVRPAATSATNLTDARVRELHTRLAEAKRSTKDPSVVSVEGLARSLKATEEKLRQQHKNRRIDFDIVIKDGKAVVKPIVR